MIDFLACWSHCLINNQLFISNFRLYLFIIRFFILSFHPFHLEKEMGVVDMKNGLGVSRGKIWDSFVDCKFDF